MHSAERWRRLLGVPDVPLRFDVVEVLLERDARPDVNRIRHAFNTDDLRRALARRR